MSYNFFLSSNITFGRNSLNELHNIIGKYHMKSVMIIYGKSVKATGTADRVIAELEEADISYCIFDGVIPNPTNEVVEEAAAVAKNEKVDGFVAVGGGSCIDLAKAVNLLMTNPGEIGEYEGMNRVKNPCLPLIAIPTTAGTSSEITNVSALIDTEKVKKYVVIDNNIVASDVIADPELTRTVPKSITAATGMDAITHAVESYISTMSTPLTEYNAIEGLKILYSNLPKVCTDLNNIDAREKMMLGCIITGFSFSNANLGLVHGIAHTLSAHFGLSHGMANATVLPHVMRYNAESCPEKMVRLAEAIGLKTTGSVSRDKYLFSEALSDLVRAIDIKTLKEQGISKDDFEMLALDVLREPVLDFNPRKDISKEEIISILNKAF